MTDAEQNLIIEQSLSSEENLRVAIKVAAAFPDLKKRIWRDFLRYLEIRLIQDLGAGWKTEILEDRPWGIQVHRVSWPADKRIGLRSDQATGTWFHYWVSSFGDTDKGIKDSLDRRIKTCKGAIDQSSVWWSFTEQFRDWNEEETIVELFRKKGAAEYWLPRLREIIDVVVPIVGAGLKRGEAKA
jgi:hypothetical protein